MSADARIQQVLRFSNYMASGFPYYTDIYVPIVNTITYNANIILKMSTNTWYTVRSNGGNSTIDRLVIGDALLGTFSETTLTGDTITIVGTVSSNHQHYCQVAWWNSTTLAIFTVDQDSPYALKLYTCTLGGVVTSKGTLIASVDYSLTGLQVGINSTKIYVQTTNNSGYFNNYIYEFLKTDLSIVNYTMPLLYVSLGGGSTIRYFDYHLMTVTSNYLWFLNRGSGGSMYLWISSILNIDKMICVSGDMSHVLAFSNSTGFYYGTDYDGLTVYFTGNNGKGAFYIAEGDLIKYGAL
jgi:hypothetical protein